MYGVIMAGGGGTRLWPKSRENYPKQMHALTGDKPLVQEMADRLAAIVGESNVFIITNSHHANILSGIMPGKSGRILIDPYRRDTAPCIGLAAAYLSKLDPDGVMGVLPADHFIADEEKFARAITMAEALAQAGRVVTIGIKPTAPETGYGYIELGELDREVGGCRVYHVKRFVEKPDRHRAEEYLAGGRHLWNSGMFVWSIPTVLALYEKHLPDIYERLVRIKEAMGTDAEQEVLLHEYRQMRRISVDYGIMEKLDDIAVIAGEFGWNDVGSWATVLDIMPRDKQGNAVKGLHIGIDTSGCLVMGGDRKLIATVGLDDLVIIDTEEALLVCRKDRAQDVKQLVDKLKDADLSEFM